MIFCVEDDAAIRNLMIYTLKSTGFEACGFSNGIDFFAALENTLPEMVILDIMLPEMDGIEILKRLRANSCTADIPVIMATAKGSEYDKVYGLDLGADDYLAKPFGMMEMVSRIKAVLRRSRPKEDKILNIGKLCVNLNEHTVNSDGVRIELTLKEYDMLCIFAKNIGKVFTRDELLTEIWGVDYLGESRTVDVHIGTLRTKLGVCGEYIKTVRGVGYRLENAE